jgi:predicted Zn finger-like uncharacterized protein
MEIVCQNCNTSHYLSDDKIPLETKTGKCKQCGGVITILGKNSLNSDTIIQQEISAESEETKKCDFCGEKILAIAKKCKHCRSMFDINIGESKPVKQSGISNVLSIIACLEIIIASLIGIVGFGLEAWLRWGIFLSGILSGLILLGFSIAIESLYESTQRLREIERLLHK